LIHIAPPSEKANYCTYIYPIADELKRTLQFFMPGKTPIEIATRVADICSRSDHVSLADMVRLDGSVSNIPRELWKRIILSFFKHEYHAEILKLFRGTYDRTAKLQVGTDALIYETMWIILSGRIDTSIFGTLTTAFSAYYAYRTQHNPPIAWGLLQRDCCAMGDDLIVGGLEAATLARGATAIGCKSDAYSVKSGHTGVVYLSRAYGPYVWEGDPVSMTCLKRQLSKFHTTVKLTGITPGDKLREKARGYLASDRYTPVLGEFCQVVEKICGPLFRKSSTLAIERWQSELDQDVQYPNQYAEWMESMARDELPEFDFEAFRAYIGSATREEQLLDLPVFMEPETVATKLPVVVNDDVHYPEDNPAEEVAKQPTEQKSVTPRCREKKRSPSKRKKKRSSQTK
jgi:hypothetical protein